MPDKRFFINILRHGTACQLWLSAAICAAVVLLASCSGGISGTGDGGPIIVISSTEISTELNQGGTADAQAPTNGVATDSQSGLPAQAYLPMPATLASLETVSLAAQPTAYQLLREQLTVAQQRQLQVQIWLDLLATDLAQITQSCSTASACAAAGFNNTFIYDSIIAEQDLARRLALIDPLLDPAARAEQLQQLQQQAQRNVGSSVMLSVNRYQLGEPIGSLQFSTDDNQSVTVQWTGDGQSVALRYRDQQLSLNSFISNTLDGTRYVLRQTGALSQTSLVAAFETAAEGLLFESDYHRAGNVDTQVYSRGISRTDSGVLISRHPSLEPAPPFSRERFVSSGAPTSLQRCDSVSSDCSVDQNWSEELTVDPLARPAHEQFRTSFGGFEQTIADDLFIEQLDNSVDEWVIATPAEPIADNLLCAGQQVGPYQRNFCWALSIDANRSQVFEETLSAAGFSYQLVQ